MSEVTRPTTSDMNRDLAADLDACNDVPACWYTLGDIRPGRREDDRDDWLLTVQLACPAAIRRARHAEAVNAALLAACEFALPHLVNEPAADAVRAAVALARGE